MIKRGMIKYGMVKYGMVVGSMIKYGTTKYDMEWHGGPAGGTPPDYFHCLSSTPYRLHARNNNTRIAQFGGIQLLLYCGNAYMTTDSEERSGRITLESLHQWWQYESENLNLLWPLTYKDTWEEACFELKHVHTTQLEILCEQRSLN